MLLSNSVRIGKLKAVLTLLAWTNYIYAGTKKKSDILQVKGAFTESSSFARLFLHIDIHLNHIIRLNPGSLNLSQQKLGRYKH
jgi:hypothetical protein